MLNNTNAPSCSRKTRQPRPQGAAIIHTYEELTGYVRAFAGGFFTLFVLIGSAGLQKSRLVRQTLGQQVLWLEGHVTPFQMYRELYEHRDEPVVIDDVDSLLRHRDGIPLLKCLCQTEPAKNVTWHSSVKRLEDECIPTSFRTTSPVLIIANTWKAFDEKVAPLEDRGHVVCFEPTPEEIHRRTAEWFTDQEVFDFVGGILHLVRVPSMRLYVKALQLKRAERAGVEGIHWREQARNQWLSPLLALVAQLKDDPVFASEEMRVQAFVTRIGKSRATYFRYAQKLSPPLPLPRITLPPPPRRGDKQSVGP